MLKKKRKFKSATSALRQKFGQQKGLTRIKEIRGLTNLMKGRVI